MTGSKSLAGMGYVALGLLPAVLICLFGGRLLTPVEADIAETPPAVELQDGSAESPAPTSDVALAAAVRDH